MSMNLLRYSTSGKYCKTLVFQAARNMNDKTSRVYSLRFEFTCFPHIETFRIRSLL